MELSCCAVLLWNKTLQTRIPCVHEVFPCKNSYPANHFQTFHFRITGSAFCKIIGDNKYVTKQ